MGLEHYQRRRNFARTPEPRGRKQSSGGFSFVIQEHAARTLHYDFRLELDGVLLSWAVPKGPSLDPAVKRLAMQTEDHPLDYAAFEGVIPQGEYGAGSVLVWDRGRWLPEGDPHEGYRRGRLSFALQGEKLRGGFHLVRTGTRPGKANARRSSWLLFKSRDAAARSGARAEIAEREPKSVLSGRTLEQVANAPDRVWHSKRVAKPDGPRHTKRPRAGRKTPPLAFAARRPDAATRSGTRPAVEPPRIRLTHPDRVLYAEQGITKADLARYYALVAERMLPHIARRPLMLLRCPEGRDKGCFFQKHPSRALPAGIERVRIREQKGMAQTMIVQNVEGLVALVQLGALEIHAWGSRVDALEQPDQLVFDLDPDEALPWSRVVEAARRVRANLLDRGLRSFLKTTGGKGLHVVVPIEASAKWDEVQAFCKALVESIAREEPDRYVTDMAKAKRKGKVFLDYLRNSRGATAVCAYSTRAREGAPVAAPIAWDELTSSLRSDGVTLADMPERLAGHDPWHDFFAVRQALPKA